MNTKNLILISLFSSFATHTMHIQDLSTPIKCSLKEKSLFLWLRDNTNDIFGNIPVYNKKSGNPPFEHIGTIDTLDPKTLENIALGRSIYCHDVFTSGYHDQGGVFICLDYDKSEIDSDMVKRTDNNFRLFYLLQLYNTSKTK